MNLIIDETGRAGVLQLDGNLTVERVGEIKEKILESLKLLDRLVIDHSEATEFDLTYLQLLISAQKTSGELKKQFSVKKSDSPGFLRILEDSGLPKPELSLPQEKQRG